MNSKEYYVKCKSAALPEGLAFNKFIKVENGCFTEIADVPTCDVPIINAEQLTMLPGLLDLHIHGREGCDVMDANRASLETISSSLLAHGVTGFLATTVTATWPQTIAAFSAIGDAYHDQLSGAQLLGAYNEGLFFTKDHKGAHDDNYFLPLQKSNLDEIMAACRGALKLVALAPELENSQAIIKYLTHHSVQVMLGHTNATYEQATEALKTGASGGVHVFNGMSGIHHRMPGCASAVLLDEKAYVEVIADGVHLHPAIIELICRLKKYSNIGLISDCISAGGMPDGKYTLGMLEVMVEKGIARTCTGSLAGSTLTLEKAIKNMIELANVPFHEAVNMASLYPAMFIGVEQNIGSIELGKAANFTLINDHFDVQATIISGEQKYGSEQFNKT